MRKRRYTDEEFRQAIKDNISVRGVLKTLGLSPTGGSYKLFYARVKALKIDISHFKGSGHLKGKRHNWNKKIPLEEILVKGSTYLTSSRLRERLIKAGTIPNKCFECGIDSWLGKHLTLHLDHIDGDNTNHEISNLRLLCPNCHSQTSTYCRRKSSLKVLVEDVPINPT